MRYLSATGLPVDVIYAIVTRVYGVAQGRRGSTLAATRLNSTGRW